MAADNIGYAFSQPPPRPFARRTLHFAARADLSRSHHRRRRAGERAAQKEPQHVPARQAAVWRRRSHGAGAHAAAGHRAVRARAARVDRRSTAQDGGRTLAHIRLAERGSGRAGERGQHAARGRAGGRLQLERAVARAGAAVHRAAAAGAAAQVGAGGGPRAVEDHAAHDELALGVVHAQDRADPDQPAARADGPEIPRVCARARDGASVGAWSRRRLPGAHDRRAVRLEGAAARTEQMHDLRSAAGAGLSYSQRAFSTSTPSAAACASMASRSQTANPGSMPS